jgi:RimJ/RimL family protein N-acetyltransferase
LITFQRTWDLELARSVITHPRLFPFLSDDHSPRPQEFRAPRDERVWYVLAYEDDELLGLWMFVHYSPVLWEVHTALLPSAWGASARAAARAMAEWLWAHTSCRRLITNVPAYNRLALRFAEAAGMRRFGVNERSLLKNGRLHDQIMLGLSRPEETKDSETPCQQL